MGDQRLEKVFQIAHLHRGVTAVFQNADIDIGLFRIRRSPLRRIKNVAGHGETIFFHFIDMLIQLSPVILALFRFQRQRRIGKLAAPADGLHTGKTQSHHIHQRINAQIFKLIAEAEQR